MLLLTGLSLSAQDSSEKTKAESIRFCTYNVKNWLSMDRFDGQKTIKGADKPEEEKAAIISILKAIKPDILGLCEIGGESDLKDLQKRLLDAGIDLPNHTVSHGGDPTRKLGFLSRFPITATNHQHSLEYKIGELTMPIQRGILDATVRVSNTFTLRFLGVHLKSMRTIPEADQALMRRNEAHLVKQHIDKIHAGAPGTHLILYGDMNEHRNEPAIEEIIGSRTEESQMHEVKVWDRNGEVWTHFWDAADSYARLDYIFVSKDLRKQIDFKKSYVYQKRTFYEASDHRPVVMELTVPTEAPRPN
jgi:endonuclease/exonuclease/phosphatase family metal-dependent hydrolase